MDKHSEINVQIFDPIGPQLESLLELSYREKDLVADKNKDKQFKNILKKRLSMKDLSVKFNEKHSMKNVIYKINNKDMSNASKIRLVKKVESVVKAKDNRIGSLKSYQDVSSRVEKKEAKIIHPGLSNNLNTIVVKKISVIKK